MSGWVVLVGPPGAGKSSVGSELARRWGVDLHDTDQAIEAQQRSSVSDIFVDQGEAVFRQLEEEAVAAALADRPAAGKGVVALGGGAVQSERNRAALVGHPVVFLDVDLATCARRVGLGVSRPLLLGNVRGQLKALMDQRRPLYEEVAQLVVHTDELSVSDVADRVEAWLA